MVKHCHLEKLDQAQRRYSKIMIWSMSRLRCRRVRLASYFDPDRGKEAADRDDRRGGGTLNRADASTERTLLYKVPSSFSQVSFVV